jgi:hypothetical protein
VKSASGEKKNAVKSGIIRVELEMVKFANSWLEMPRENSLR